jgi:hypothetical protein
MGAFSSGKNGTTQRSFNSDLELTPFFTKKCPAGEITRDYQDLNPNYNQLMIDM